MKRATVLLASALSLAAQSIPIACNPKAIPANERARYNDLTKSLRTAARDLRELPEGYAIQLDGSKMSLREAADWIAYERLCCPFLKFELSVSGKDTNWTLVMTGPDGTKSVLQAEFSLKSAQSK